MDRRIDLTLNRDFGSVPQITEITRDEFNGFVADMYDQKNMTSEDYEKLVKYESFFGRKRHFTDALTVFTKSNEEYVNDMMHHCMRCGKEFRIPWKVKGDLCEECEKKIEPNKTFKDIMFGGISFDFGTDDKGRDLFSLR